MKTVVKDIGLVKSKIVSAIQDSEDIKSLLLNDREYSDEYWYGNGKDDMFGVVYKRIFPYLFADDINEDTSVYICCEVDVPRVPTTTIKDLTVTVWCICDKDAMRCRKEGYLGTRADMLADAVEKALRKFEVESATEGKSAFGIGKLALTSVKSMPSINNDYYGRSLTFMIPDFKMKGR